MTLPHFNSNQDAALFWYRYGLKSIPIVPGEKRPALPHSPWLDNVSAESIQRHWRNHPDHDVGCVLTDGIVVLDADTPEAEAALWALEREHGVPPLLRVRTRKGVHHYFRREPSAFDRADSHDTSLHPTRRDVHNKPRIRIVEGELPAMVDAAQVILAGTGEYFQHGGQIVKVAFDGRTGAASFQQQTDADLTLALSRAADWERSEMKSEIRAWRRCNPPPTCVRLLVQAQTYAYLPAVRGIARQPVLDREGRLVSAVGYEPASQLYCAFDPAKYGRPEPTEANAREAMGRLLYLEAEAIEQRLEPVLVAVRVVALEPAQRVLA